MLPRPGRGTIRVPIANNTATMPRAMTDLLIALTGSDMLAGLRGRGLMVVDRYRGHSMYQDREVTNYRVLDGKETFRVHDEATGRLRFTFTAFYNPKRLLRPEDKEAVLADLLTPALEAVRAKIDAEDFTDGFMHVDPPRAMPGGVAGPAPAQRG